MIAYATNAIQRLHNQVRKTIQNKGHFQGDEPPTKLIHVSLRALEAKWKRPPKEWHAAKSQLAKRSGDRFTFVALNHPPVHTQRPARPLGTSGSLTVFRAGGHSRWLF